MKTIITKNAPPPAGPYSQAVVSDGFVYASGQIPIDPVSGVMPEGIEDQTKMVLKNLISILSAAGVGKNGILKVTVYLTDMNDFGSMNSIYSETFTAPFPARTCIGVSSLPKGAKIMMDAVGALS